MKLTKRILAVMLSFLMILTSANIVVLGAGDPTITVSSATATNGDTVDVTVTMTGNPGIISVTLDLEYDTSALTLTGVTDSGLLAGQMHTTKYTSPYRLTWANDTAPSNYTVEGVLATLHFTVNEDAAAGDYAITASIPKDGIYNYDADNVDFALVNGTVTVVEEHTHSMEYCSAVEATCAAAGNVEYWACSGCGLFFSDEEGTGIIDDVVLPVDSTNHTGGTEVRDAVEATDTADGYTGDTYCLGCGTMIAEGEVIPATGGEEVPEDAAKIVVSNDRGRAGETVEVEISLENNPGFVSMLFDVNYDSTYLTLVEVTDTGLITGSTHDLSDLTRQPLTLCWQNWTISDNITSDGVIAKLTFEVAENAPADIEVSVSVSYDYDNYDITDVDFEPVYFATVPGTITIIDTLYGDVNDDGKVNMVDSGLLARYVARWSGYAELVDMDAADVNNDGKVNMVDSGILARHVAKWSDYAVLPYGSN